MSRRCAASLVADMGWRDHLPVHPAAALFPLMSESELRELGKNIRANGLIAPIIVIPVDGRSHVLDGRNRLDAMELEGITLDPKFLKACMEDPKSGSPAIQTITDADPYDYVLAINVHRRHLTGEQKRELIVRVLKAKPEASNRKIAEQTKADHKTVAAVRDDLESTGEIPQLEKTTGADGKQRKSRAKKATEPSSAKTATESPEISPEQRKAEHAALDDPIEEEGAPAEERWQITLTKQADDLGGGDDIVERCLSLIIAMNKEQRAQFFAKYTELSAARAPARP
jgi:acetyl/propionyl-CoA carboxylase alpha subunit